MGVTPTVAIVGRPNVGKSTLFNRLLGRRKAIVHDRPGVTRDRIAEIAELDIEHHIQLIDTGGLVPGDDPLGLNQQVLFAVEESDLVLFVVDGKEGLVAADETVWEELRRFGKPTILVINKGDTRAAQETFYDFFALGIEPHVLLSAEHNQGVGELRERIVESLPRPEPAARDLGPRLAIVGRPNVGKSSLLNRLLGQERALVSAVPGTTRDPIDTIIEWEGNPYVLIDTAGIRRRGKTADAPEEVAIMMARRQLEQADLALLVVDAAQGVTTGDLAIAGTAWELGRACVILVNKWDLLDEANRKNLEESWQRLDEVLSEPRRVNLSALSGRGVQRVFPAVEETLEAFNVRLGTADLNRLIDELVRRHQPPVVRGQDWRVLYSTQVRTAPPTFMLFANRKLPRQSSYRRYLENGLRRELGLAGIPLRLVIRQR
jgi:GTP-binding protein